MEKKAFNDGWKFCLENEPQVLRFGFQKAGEGSGYASRYFDDSSWRNVDLPHDWGVELGYDLNTDGSHGHRPISLLRSNAKDEFGNALGLKTYSVGWYRKTFFVPKEALGKRFILEFEGVYRDSIVWVNGTYYGRHCSGYVGYHYDITDNLIYGEENVISVRVNAKQYEGWWYEGAGIYRNVWLHISDSVHIPLYETQILSDVGGSVTVNTVVQNDGDDDFKGTVRVNLYGPENNLCATSETDAAVSAFGQGKVSCDLVVQNPQLWDIDEPNVYRAEIQVINDGIVFDTAEDTFGFRNLLFDVDKGFFLNGKHVKINGMCIHQDFAGIGVALTRGMQYYKIQKLREMGVNGYRSAHHPPAPDLLEACDRLGMMVMAEQRYCSSSPEGRSQMEYFIKRDRNHPSIILWSVGNEEGQIQNNDIGARVARSLINVIHKYDTTREITYGGNNGSQYDGINAQMKVRGVNYIHIGGGFWDQYHAEHPDQALIGSEEASSFLTRGIYKNDKKKGYVNAYEENTAPWGATALGWVRFYEKRDYFCGGFAWTGFDYRGEPAPFQAIDNMSHFGIIDLCGFPKDVFYYYQSWWTKKTVLHLFPHWNFEPGEAVKVVVYTNCDFVELYLNGKKIAEKSIEFLGNATFEVPFESGTIEAVGYRGGKEIIRKHRTTAGLFGSVQLHKVECPQLEEEKIVYVEAQIADSDGNEICNRDEMLYFDIEGGKIIGVGNGDPAAREPEQYLERTIDKAVGGWQEKHGEEWVDTDIFTEYKGRYSVESLAPEWDYAMEEKREPFEDEFRVVWRPGVNVHICQKEYRCFLQSEGEEVEMYFPFLSGGYTIYLNDEVIRHCSKENFDIAMLSSQPCMVKLNLKKGENIVRVAIDAQKIPSGIYQGAYLRTYEKPHWKMHTFGGKCLIMCKKNSEKARVIVRAENGVREEIEI